MKLKYILTGCICLFLLSAAACQNTDDTAAADGNLSAETILSETSAAETKEQLVPYEKRFYEAAEYEEFLAGECTASAAQNAYVDVSFIGGFLNDSAFGSSFSVDDLMKEISDEMIEMRGTGSIGRMEYALIDCGSDGKKQLALRAYGLDIYSLDDDSDLTMVFDYRDGNIMLIYAVDSWARSDSELYNNGYVSGGGSGGAATHYVWEGIIGADGVYRRTYDCYTETGQGLYGMSSCQDIRDQSGGDAFPAEFNEYEINGESIYSYYILDDVTDEERKIVMDYIKDNEARMGICFLTDDEAWAQVEKTRRYFGVTDEMGTEENRIVWRTLV